MDPSRAQKFALGSSPYRRRFGKLQNAAAPPGIKRVIKSDD
jgi:hypothetical protein